MNEKMKAKIVNHFEELAKEYSVKLPASDYTVNCKAGRKYARDCFATIDDAIEAMLSRGEGFNLGASFDGGWSHGNSAGTSDIGINLTNNELIQLLLT